VWLIDVAGVFWVVVRVLPGYVWLLGCSIWLLVFSVWILVCSVWLFGCSLLLSIVRVFCVVAKCC